MEDNVKTCNNLRPKSRDPDRLSVCKMTAKGPYVLLVHCFFQRLVQNKSWVKLLSVHRLVCRYSCLLTHGSSTTNCGHTTLGSYLTPNARVLLKVPWLFFASQAQTFPLWINYNTYYTPSTNFHHFPTPKS